VCPPNQGSEELLTLEADAVALCCNSSSSLQPEQCFTGAATIGGKQKLPLRATPRKKTTAIGKDGQDRKEFPQKVQHVACCGTTAQRGVIGPGDITRGSL